MSVLDYPNGQVPTSEMDQYRGLWGAPDAIRAIQLIIALAALAGYVLTPNEIYRSLAMQVYYRNLYLSGKGNPAAIPGTSNHGYGLAADFNYPLTSWTTAAQAWFRANEARFQLSSAQGVADGEPWHKVYIGPLTTPAGGGATPLPAPKLKGADMIGIVKAKSNWGPIYQGWTFAVTERGVIPLDANAVGLAKWAGQNIAEWDGKDIWHEAQRLGLWEFTGAAGQSDPGMLTGRLIFGYASSGGWITAYPGQGYPARAFS